MKTQIWNRTTIVWNADYFMGGFQTNLPVDDWHDKKEKFFHKINDLRIISLPGKGDNRQAIIKIQIFRFSAGPTTKREEILIRLKNLDASILEAKDANGIGWNFQASYRLDKGESFCDSAIKKAQQILRSFGVEDKDRFILADFLPLQETLVKTKKDSWVPYGDYLRHKHKLPQVCSLYKKKIALDGGLVMHMDYQQSPSNFLHTS